MITDQSSPFPPSLTLALVRREGAPHRYPPYHDVLDASSSSLPPLPDLEYQNTPPTKPLNADIKALSGEMRGARCCRLHMDW